MRKISVIEKLIITVSAVITLSGVLLAGLIMMAVSFGVFSFIG